MEENRGLALFDFDGTITKKDTFIEFIVFSRGSRRLLLGFLFLSPWLILMKLKLYPNWRAKERMVAFHFKGMKFKEFQFLSEKFAEDRIPHLLRKNALTCIEKHKKRGDKIYVISASPRNWIQSWTASQEIELISTELEVRENTISGKINGKNCYGIEKVNQLKERVNVLNFDKIYAYGDSRGDKELLSIATDAFYRPFR